RAGEPLRVLADLRASGSARAARLTLELRGADGAMLFRTATDVVLGDDGGVRLSFDVPALALLAGDYDLVLGAAAADEDAFLERTVRFSVASDSDARGVL